jgi:hypothetical protein
MFAASKTSTSALTDPQFNYVTMLLHGDGTNGAQNNTFVDSSTNNFTITRNGNTTQGSFSPYGSGWGAYFNAGANIGSATWNSAGVFGTSDFTVECWIYAVASQNNNQVIFTNNAYPSTTGFYFRYTGNGSTNFTVNTGTTTLITASGGWSLNAWHHVAVTRASGTMTLWIDGVSRGTASFTNNCSDGMQYIGRASDTDANYFMQGYLSNFRITKSAALYTSTFTPSTTPLTTTVSSGTVSLLCLQSNRFIDNSSNAYALTANNTPSVQRFNPFGTTTAYSTSVIGGSGYFVRSSSQYLTVSNAGGQFSFGTGAFTIECWVNLASMPSGTGYPASYWLFGGGPVNSDAGIDFYINNTQIGFNLTAFTSSTAIGNHGMSVGNWYHVAVVRGGGSNQTVSIYVNGTRVATASSVTATADVATTGIAISAAEPSGATSGNFDGYISNYRVVKGTAVYDPTSSTLTVPTAPLTAITNTQLLLNFTNGAIFDNAMMNDLETAGNAQISTSVKKYGTGSLAFDGTDDVISFKNNPSFAFGTGSFTIEFWINGPLNNDKFILEGRNAIGTMHITTGGSASTAGVLRYVGSSTIVSSNVITDSTWHHCAIVRNGSSNITLYVDGVSVGTGTDTTNYTTTTGTFDGIGGRAGVGNYLTAYIDDFRITKGYARYTANFTPPTAAFSNTGPV